MELLQQIIIHEGFRLGPASVPEQIDKQFADQLTESRDWKLQNVHVIGEHKWMLDLSELMNGKLVLE